MNRQGKSLRLVEHRQRDFMHFRVIFLTVQGLALRLATETQTVQVDVFFYLELNRFKGKCAVGNLPNAHSPPPPSRSSYPSRHPRTWDERGLEKAVFICTICTIFGPHLLLRESQSFASPGLSFFGSETFYFLLQNGCASWETAVLSPTWLQILK